MTTVAGNAGLEATTRNAGRILALLGRSDIPVAAGAERPVVRERWVLEDIEVGGVPIRRGEEVALLFASANRDPDAFTAPDTIDLGRAPNPHLAFGAGIHYCLGAPMARLELQTAFATILRRMPRLELVEPPAWKSTFVLRGVATPRVRC